MGMTHLWLVPMKAYGVTTPEGRLVGYVIGRSDACFEAWVPRYRRLDDAGRDHATVELAAAAVLRGSGVSCPDPLI